jgi:transcriptional regulator with XRE-family HTH domain
MYLNLKMQIWRSGLRQNRLAQMLGVDEALLSKIVNGYRLPNAHMRAQIAKLLCRDEEWLFAVAEQTVNSDEKHLLTGESEI